jgi:hypothetical protein
MSRISPGVLLLAMVDVARPPHPSAEHRRRDRTLGVGWACVSGTSRCQRVAGISSRHGIRESLGAMIVDVLQREPAEPGLPAATLVGSGTFRWWITPGRLHVDLSSGSIAARGRAGETGASELTVLRMGEDAGGSSVQARGATCTEPRCRRPRLARSLRAPRLRKTRSLHPRFGVRAASWIALIVILACFRKPGAQPRGVQGANVW